MSSHPGSDRSLTGVPPTQRARLFHEYARVVAILTSTALIVSGAVSMVFSYRENLASMSRLQEEQALRAATSIELFLGEIERQIDWTMPPGRTVSPLALNERLDDYLRLLRQYPAIAEVRYLDAAGKEQLLISRWQINRIGSQEDASQNPAYREALDGNTFFGTVYFREGSEPYMTVSMREQDPDGGVTVAEVNLKLIWELVSRIEIGAAGRAYVVDSRGNLIADPEIWPVLRQTNLAALPQVATALTASSTPGSGPPGATLASDARGREVFTSHHVVAPTAWLVFVEQPVSEVLAPINALLLRTGLLLVAGLAMSIGASLLLAHRMVTPITLLTTSVRQIGMGALGHRVEVRTGNELELLAHEFNAMAARLEESHSSLQRQVAERTAHLEQALAALKENEERLQVERATLLSIMTSMTDGLVVLEPGGRIRYCNAQAAQLFHLESEDLVGQSIDELIDRLAIRIDGQPANGDLLRAALARVETRPCFEITLDSPLEHVQRQLEIQLFPIAESESQPTNVGIVLRDITSVKLLSYLQERERIAMDLHDGVIQSLYAVALSLTTRERMLSAESDETRAAFRQAQDQIRDVIQEARKYSLDLRMNQHTAEKGTTYDVVEGIERLASHLSVNGVAPTLDLADDVNEVIDGNAGQHVLYIARETVSNILRHANADEAFVSLTRSEGHVVLIIRDNGQGFDVAHVGRRSGHGLRNMSERTAALGGQLEVSSKPGKGTKIKLVIPVASGVTGPSEASTANARAATN